MKLQLTFTPSNAVLADLKEFPGNTRKHSKKQIKTLVENINTFGFTSVIHVDEEGFILEGHARVEAAKLTGFEALPAQVVTGFETHEQKELYVAADNKIKELGKTDKELEAKQVTRWIELEMPVQKLGFKALTLSTPDVKLDVKTPTNYKGKGPKSFRLYYSNDKYRELTIKLGDLMAEHKKDDHQEVVEHIINEAHARIKKAN